MKFFKNLENTILLYTLLNFIRASRRSIKQKLQTPTAAPETVNNFTDEVLLVSIDDLAMNAYHAQC